MDFRYRDQSGEKLVRLERSGDHYIATIGDQQYEIELISYADQSISFVIRGPENRHRQAYVASSGSQRFVAVDSDVYMLSVETEAEKKRALDRKRSSGAAENELTASMPGQVVSVLVAEGDQVRRGQPLVVLEAMKMEIRVTAQHDSKVAKILCQPGQVVERGQVLLQLTTE
jgi:biotin carboxyl carrier protein